MSFEEKLTRLQKKNPTEKKTVVLITTTVIFIPLMAALMYFGAFSLSGGSNQNPVNDVFERDVQPISETLDRIGSQFIASTTQSLNEIKQIASSSNQVFLTGTSSTSSLAESIENNATSSNATSSNDARLDAEGSSGQGDTLEEGV